MARFHRKLSFVGVLMKRWSTLLLILTCNLSPIRAEEPSRAAVEFFENKIRPLLVEQCFSCHSGKKQRGGLNLESRANLLKGGDTGPALVPGEAAKSLLIRAVSYKEELRMPPRSKLSDQQIADLTAWVEQGAPWPGSGATSAPGEKIDLQKLLSHWSFQPMRLPSLPAVARSAWPRNAIDHFVLAKLEQHGLTPAPEADRRTLLRRLTFDLTGLPPTPEEIRSFLDDRSPLAYIRVVDRLLASPAYGERWGRHWLDLMRFAETSGHEFDFEISQAYLYRDYVIRAVNDDLPYDDFVREHLAGDLLPTPRRHPAEQTNESILGTGFWFLGESKHSPVDLRVDGADRRDNMIDVFGKAFLGLTLSCARCHDHKFDPITTREYYSLVSYLQSSRQQRAFLDPPERIGKPAAEIAALREQAARLAIDQTSRLLEARWKALPERPTSTTGRHETLIDYIVFDDFSQGDYRNWYVTGEAFGTAPASVYDVELDPTHTPPVRRIFRGAHSGRVSQRLMGALRSKTFTISKKFIHYRVRGTAVKVNLILDGFQLIQDPIYGGLRFAVHSTEPRWHVQDVSMWQGLQGYIELLDDGDGFLELEQVVFSDRPEPPIEASVSATREQQLEAIRHWREGKPVDRRILDALLSDARLREKAAPTNAQKLQELLARAAELEAKLPTPRRGLAMADGTAVEERVHIRGNPKTLGETAPRVLPAVLVGQRQPVSRQGSGRLEMAQRLTEPDNPLLARVIVNRLWHHHFGAGLVRSCDDFGHQGDRPTHPELLDWLALELQRSGWSLKHLHRLMVLSRTYQMSSRGEDNNNKIDPLNLYLHRMPIRRLEAEAIRDALLAVSGRLDRRMFGKGPLPHLTEFMVGRGRPAKSGPLDGDGRRSVYLNLRRNFLPPMFLAFDYPTPFTCIGRRGVSNVPAQALTLMNNPLVLQQARLWAERTAGLGDRERIQAMYEVAYGREASTEELAQALEFLGQQGGTAQSWTDLAHVLFNVKEFIFVN